MIVTDDAETKSSPVAASLDPENSTIWAAAAHATVVETEYALPTPFVQSSSADAPSSKS